MMFELTVEDPRWHRLEPLSHAAIQAVLDHCGLDAETCEVSVLGCDDVRIAELNASFRSKAVPTNVLSWPAEDLAADEPGHPPRRPEPDFAGDIALGDIAIAYDTCANEAAAAGKSMDDHVTHLIVHGVLHLLGYDHIRDPDATLMEQVEVEILGKMGIDDPYSTPPG
ncbi:MAG: rRNA maturation RNase YbeY [Pseudomonadota bacterium]